MHYCTNNWNGNRGHHNHNHNNNNNNNNNKHNDFHKIKLKNHSGSHLGNHDQKEEVLTHRGTENSWITNHLIATEMTKETLGAMVVGRKDILERIVWLKGQT